MKLGKWNRLAIEDYLMCFALVRCPNPDPLSPAGRY